VSYIYLKTEIKPSVNKKKKYLSLIFLFSGLLLLAFVTIPIIKFQLQYSTNLKQIINPLSLKSYNRNSSVLGDNTDYTQLSNWFTNDSISSSNNLTVNDNGAKYFLTIPKLGIKEATVIIGSTDLKSSLIQYPQTALPGQLGDAIIFGHSVLPQFFNSKNYLTIFSTLYTLKQGDEIIANYGGIEYKYIVDEMFEVKPTDLSVLAQNYNHKNLTLITCTPPGTYLRRLVIRSSLAVK